MNNKLIFVLSFLVIMQSEVCKASQFSDMQKISISSNSEHNQKESAHEKYARYLATTPELDNQLLLKNITVDLLSLIMTFLVGGNFADTTENYVTWQEEREQKFLSACVAWQLQDIEYIKENLRLDLWLNAFSDLYHHEIDKDSEFEKQLEKIVHQTSLCPRPSKLFSIPTHDSQYTLYSYLQQLHSSQYRDEVEIAALMLFSHEPADHYFSQFTILSVVYNPVEGCARKLQKNYKRLEDINARNDNGNTLAYQAVDAYFIPVIHACIKAGIDFNQENKSLFLSKDFDTPLDIVQSRALKSHLSEIRYREICYGIWKILDQAGIKNNQSLLPCPTRQVMQAELDRSIKEWGDAYFYENGRHEYEYGHMCFK